MVDPVKLEHFRNLVSLSAADGRVEEAERTSLVRIASALGIPSDRLHVMLTHACLSVFWPVPGRQARN